MSSPAGQSIIARTVFAVAALLATTLLGIFHVLEAEAVTALVTLLTGYILGNGVLMTKRTTSSENDE